MLPLLLAQLALAAAAPAAVQPSSLGAPEAMQQGLQHYRDADFEGAIPFFQRAAIATSDEDKKGKSSAEIWLGLSFLNIGNSDLAKQSFRAALLADLTAKLPDEAPPAAIPMYANIKGDLERTAPKPREQPKQVARQDVPRSEAHPDTSADHRDTDRSLAPDLTASEETSTAESAPFQLPRWVPQAVAGAGAGLMLGGGYFKLASSSSFNDAAAEPNAARAAELSHHADSQQHLARGLALGGLAMIVTGTVLYLLNE